MNIKLLVIKWFAGLWNSFIAGGAGAVASGVAAPILDPEKFNPITQTKGWMEFVGATFIIAGVIHSMAYLAKKPSFFPDDTTFFDKPPTNK